MTAPASTVPAARPLPSWAVGLNLPHLWGQSVPGLALRALAAIDDGPGGTVRRAVARAVLGYFDRKFGIVPDAARMTPGDVARDAAIEASCLLRLRVDTYLSSAAPSAEAVAALRAEAADPKALSTAAFVTLPASVRAQAEARRCALLLPALLCRVATYATADAGDVAALVAFADDAEDRPGELRDFQAGADFLDAIRAAVGPVAWPAAK